MSESGKVVVTKAKLDELANRINEKAGSTGPKTIAELTQTVANIPSALVTSVNGATGDVKSTFYVTVTQGDNNTATADKTAEEVYAAYEAGYAVYANLQGTTLPLAGAISNSGVVILGFGTILSTGPWDGLAYAAVLYSEGVWLAWNGTLAELEDIPTHLPNQFPLEIKIGDTTKSYDGSMRITVKIPEGVPSVTAADNGKFLRVANGAWAAVEIANANGVSF